jgi:hypothetical protein
MKLTIGNIRRHAVMLAAATGVLLAYAPSISKAAGQYNTATGVGALDNTTTGSSNTADGQGALNADTTGSHNSGVGFQALFLNTSGSKNTATGYQALYANTTGSNNTASGFEALRDDTTGSNNSATGYGALYLNQTGNDNTAAGYDALLENESGLQNTAVGFGALFANNGDNNTALGQYAGVNLTTGSNNIDIGDANLDGKSDDKAAESNTIRIGELNTQQAAYIAGIYGETAASGAKTVVIDSTGKLGTSVASNADPIAALGMRNEIASLKARNNQLAAAYTQQQQEIKVLAARLRQQEFLLEKVSAQIEVDRPAPQVVSNGN